MKKKIIYGLLAIMLCVTLTGCGDKKEDNKTNNSGNTNTHQNEPKVSNSWPSTKFPEPENCEIVSVSDTFDEKQIIVKWDNKDAFNNYIAVLESMGEEEIGSYEDSEQAVWNTMNIYVSYSELDENSNNILIIY